MQLVQTKARWTVPFKEILMRCKLGSTMRKLLPTTLEPAPPFFFSIPRLLYFLPDVGPLSQTIQDLMKLPLWLSYKLVKIRTLNILEIIFLSSFFGKVVL